ncbi:hypothetical protein LCGC14_1288830, partial [marine sediment metagenome]
VVIQGLDVLDVVKFIGKKNKRFQAILLKELEEYFPIDIKTRRRSDDFYLIRKLFLDGFNNYTRSVLRIIFGDIERLES